MRLEVRNVCNYHSPNVSTTPITAMGCEQCLPISVVQLKGKHCRKPHCRNGVVDTLKHRLPLILKHPVHDQAYQGIWDALVPGQKLAKIAIG